ncbi:hypothetical protein WKW80_05730 [Variovorax humicola]|uniref:Uncharacterized protein n=1 Tax=Variovorax humicola TaxID=1769758 RepID=A0ABU8VUQ0_9BURK
MAAIDFDTKEPATALLLTHARRFTLARYGREAARRFGRVGRAMLLMRTSEPMRKTAIEFEGGQKIELLGEGHQIVTDGTHPSGAPYRLVPPLNKMRPADLLEVTVAEMRELMVELREVAELAGLVVVSDAKTRAVGGSHAPPDPAELGWRPDRSE